MALTMVEVSSAQPNPFEKAIGSRHQHIDSDVLQIQSHLTLALSVCLSLSLALQGNLFLGSSTIVLQAVDKQATLHGLIVTGNVFHSWNTANSTSSSGNVDAIQIHHSTV